MYGSFGPQTVLAESVIRQGERLYGFLCSLNKASEIELCGGSYAEKHDCCYGKNVFFVCHELLFKILCITILKQANVKDVELLEFFTTEYKVCSEIFLTYHGIF